MGVRPADCRVVAARSRSWSTAPQGDAQPDIAASATTEVGHPRSRQQAAFSTSVPSSRTLSGVTAARRGRRGMPSRISPRPAPTSGRRPSMAGSGHPPASTAGSDLSWRLGEGQRQGTSGRRGNRRLRLSALGLQTATDERTHAAVGDSTAAAPALPAGAHERRSPSRAPGVRATGSADPNQAPRAALTPGRATSPGEHTPRCARRAERTITKLPHAALSLDADSGRGSTPRCARRAAGTITKLPAPH